MTVIRRLIWDSWNIAHIARHGVTPDEVEAVCHGRPLVSETYMGRTRLIGPSMTGRMLTVILAPKGEDIYFVVTARPASRKERARYSENKRGNH